MARSYSMENRARARERTRQQLLDAATTLIIEKGTRDQTMAAVAGRADVSVRTLYTHFASFGELLAAAMSAITAEFSEMAPEPVDTSSLDPRAALRLLAHQWFEELNKNDERLAALVAIRDAPELDAALSSARKLRLSRVRAVLALAQSRGELRVPLESAVAVAYTATGYHAWRSLKHDLGLATSSAAELVADSIEQYAFDCGP